MHVGDAGVPPDNSPHNHFGFASFSDAVQRQGLIGLGKRRLPHLSICHEDFRGLPVIIDRIVVKPELTQRVAPEVQHQRVHAHCISPWNVSGVLRGAPEFDRPRIIINSALPLLQLFLGQGTTHIGIGEFAVEQLLRVIAKIGLHDIDGHIVIIHGRRGLLGPLPTPQVVEERATLSPAQAKSRPRLSRLRKRTFIARDSSTKRRLRPLYLGLGILTSHV
mmetsp:Transcript_124903/g.279157  ORF Transcript_124903/g.279157 Transcript_124903/m.279157 type:complete len:220 (-) Transcript_124903:153-812(-)